MRTPLNALVTEKALHFVSVRRNSDLLDMVAADPDHEDQFRNVLKNVCAKVSVDLSNDIDEICNLLSISKRAFLEAAMIEAVSKARMIMDKEGFWDAFREECTNYDLSNASISDGDA